MLNSYIHLTHLFKSSSMKHVFLIYDFYRLFKLKNRTIRTSFRSVRTSALQFEYFLALTSQSLNKSLLLLLYHQGSIVICQLLNVKSVEVLQVFSFIHFRHSFEAPSTAFFLVCFSAFCHNYPYCTTIS